MEEVCLAGMRSVPVSGCGQVSQLYLIYYSIVFLS